MTRKLFIQMDEIHPQLKEFIVDYCTKYKIRKVDPHTLCLETSIDLDLDIVDIEIDLFLAEFAEKFRIDQSKFSWYKYGYPTGSASVKVIRTLFGYKATWVKRLSNRIYTPRFRVSNLQDAVITGKLI
ncbi:DUF1493 family protein [Mucilaginibacter sp. BJC16-A38]|uniref:DUF1493 family protein n=1 Tax=Mucilaginibacter phenanthrenivorans TaxID=1234842 RepID=UPI002157791C|nr:DUF1493 family protein [Mucilaginibacter phenanthrenivorans]MCR8561695.1 DUF1493 family protein [Mucilaginibacter phenanthrenivorans]